MREAEDKLMGELGREIRGEWHIILSMHVHCEYLEKRS